jgi:hypothetical protein
MKTIVIIFLNLLILNIAMADLFKVNKKNRASSQESGKTKVSDNKDLKNTENKKKHKKNKKNIKSSNKSEVSAINAEGDKKNAEVIKSYLNSRNLGITDNTNTFNVNTGTTMKGIILNSIVSSNLESPILVQITESNCDIPIGAKLVCSGATRGKRVLTGCSKLVSSSDEFEINAILLNIDGTAGLTGEIFTGKEELVMGALVGGGLSAALDVSRDRVSTATGELATNSQRNKIITGAMGGLDEAVQIMGDEAKTKETKISIDAGKEVLIFINQRFKI